MADRTDFHFRQKVTEAELDLAFELVAVILAALLVADEDGDIIVPLQMGERVEQHRMALPRGEAARQHDDRFAVRQAPLAGELHEARLGHGGSTEDGG